MDAFDLRQWEGFTSAGGSLTEPSFVDQIVIDSRRIDSHHALFVALKGNKEDGHNYVEHAARAGAKFALVSQDWHPSFSPSFFSGFTLLRVERPLQAFQAIAKTYRLGLPTRILGVAGSFGKTMVKDLLYLFLAKQKHVAASPESFNSQIGVPLSLLTLHQHHEIAIIEAAISHKEEMDILADMIRPNYTLLTPLGKKHLATLQDINTLTSENLKLTRLGSSQQWALLPNDSLVKEYCPSFSFPHFFWSECYPDLPHATIPSKTSSSYQVVFPNGQDYSGTIYTGHAYFLNLLNMAIKAAWLLGVSSADIISTLHNYRPEPTRTEIWKSPLGATFINDTYCSDPQSIDQSISYFDYASSENRRTFVFGGIRNPSISSQMDYRRVGKALSQSHLRRLLLVGQKSFKPLIEEMQHHSIETEILSFDGYEETFSYLQHHLQGNDFIVFKGENKISLDVLTERFNESAANNQCVINLAAIQTNIALIRKKLPSGTRVMVMVKALAYGTDDVRMAKFLASCGIDILGVSYVDEGITLKRSGVRQSIFSIHAAPYEIAKAVKWELEVGVSDSQFAAALAQEASLQNKKIKVHLHINTGMGRFGCRPEEAYTIARQISLSPSLELEGIMTHFACAEDPSEDHFTLEQAAIFDRVIQTLKEQGVTSKWQHAANSSGALRFQFAQYNMVRLGLGVYGLYSSEATRKSLDLRLSLSLTSRVVGINICKYGETISYGRKYRVATDMQKIAVLPIGYFDGLHRHYSGKAHVMIRGQKAPMVGNICMDYLMVDVTNIPDIAVGDKALIFGEDEFGYYLSPEELAVSGDSIIHELMTCLGPRIQRVFVYEEGKQIR